MSDAPRLNLLKLCVGAESVGDLAAWIERRRAAARAAGETDLRHRHVTRMRPRRAEELLAGGSLYWVFKGVILARQRILDLDEATGADGATRCAIVLDDEIVRTRARTCRPFQGWRYLSAEAAPPDLGGYAQAAEALPAELEEALDRFGVAGAAGARR